MISRKVLLVDDHKVIIDGIEIFINSIEGYEVAGKAMTGKEALDKAKSLNPDVIILDHNLPDSDGEDLIPTLLEINKDFKIVMLTSFEDPDLAIRVIKSGAKGYLTKNIDEKGLARVLNGLFKGDTTWLDPNITYQVISNVRPEVVEEKQMFTEEEKELLKLVAKGKTNQQIANDLYLTEQTVKNYLLKIYKKYSLRNRSEAVALAVKHKII